MLSKWNNKNKKNDERKKYTLWKHTSKTNAIFNDNKNLNKKKPYMNLFCN